MLLRGSDLSAELKPSEHPRERPPGRDPDDAMVHVPSHGHELDCRSLFVGFAAESAFAYHRTNACERY